MSGGVSVESLATVERVASDERIRDKPRHRVSNLVGAEDLSSIDAVGYASGPVTLQFVPAGKSCREALQVLHRNFGVILRADPGVETAEHGETALRHPVLVSFPEKVTANSHDLLGTPLPLMPFLKILKL